MIRNVGCKVTGQLIGKFLGLGNGLAQLSVSTRWLLIWTAIGLAFRLVNVTALPPWTDECATIAFSAGNGFLDVPTDRLISTAELTAPLWLDPRSTIADVWHVLSTESTHPPLYFFLAHYWMQLWTQLWSPVAGFGWESRESLLWVARSLPALLGAASIPAMYGLARVAFGGGQPAIAHLAAALMAVSPFAVSLAREARHYTLVLLFVIGSIACTIAIARPMLARVSRPKATAAMPPPPGDRPATHLDAIAVSWGALNACGMATHYFFALTLLIEAVTVLGAIGWLGLKRGRWLDWRGWRVLLLAAVPTVLGAIVWIPAWQGLSDDNSLTAWVYDGTPGLDALFRLLSWLTAMFFALPTDEMALPLGWLIVNGLVLLALFAALGRWVTIGVLQALRSPPRSNAIDPLALRLTLGLVGCGLAAILGFTFLRQSDLTLAARFSYPYFPALVLLVAAGLGQRWQRGRYAPIAIVLIAGAIGATTTLLDLTYLQHHRPDRMAEVIADRAERTVLVTTRHKHHGQTGRAIGVAWELGRLATAGQTALTFDDPDTANVRYLLASHDESEPTPTSPGETLRALVLARSGELEVWMLNFRTEIDWEGTGCDRDRRDRPDVREYNYRRFICAARASDIVLDTVSDTASDAVSEPPRLDAIEPE